MYRVMMCRKKRGNERGFTLPEVLAVLAVIIGALAVLPGYIKEYSDNALNQHAAQHQKLIAEAAAKYIEDNYSAVLAQATPTSPAVISVAMLKSAGYLPASFSERNAFNQTYTIRALQPQPNKLETLIVTTGGETISDINVRRVAQLVGAKGGFIASTNTAVAQGAYGGWQTTLTPYGVSPGAGHLATALFFDDGALVDDYLYRRAVPGRPELNRMLTAIDMNNNNISNANVVTANRAQLAADLVAGTNVAAGGDIQASGNVVAGGDVQAAGNVQGLNLTASGTVQGASVISTGRLRTDEYLHLNRTATVGANCAPNGLVARDTNGVILSCQSGVWRAPSGSDLNTGMPGSFCQPGRNCGRAGTVLVLCLYAHDGLSAGIVTNVTYNASYGIWGSGSVPGGRCDYGVFFLT